MEGLRFAALLLLLGCAVKAEDVCQLPSKSGMCMASIPSYFYNSKTRNCEQFFYGGCGGNGNRFNSKTECLSKCGKEDVCQLPSESGLCMAYIPSYFYNSKTRNCEQFVYGGCGGNGNRFSTRMECLNKCGKVIRGINLCQLPAETGRCKGYFPKYFYNSETGACEQFIYGGCGGNGNRFDSQEACQNACA